MFGIGNGTLILLGIGVVIGLMLYPAGRAFLHSILNRIVADVGKITHSRVVFTPTPAPAPVPPRASPAVATASPAPATAPATPAA